MLHQDHHAPGGQGHFRESPVTQSGPYRLSCMLHGTDRSPRLGEMPEVHGPSAPAFNPFLARRDARPQHRVNASSIVSPIMMLPAVPGHYQNNPSTQDTYMRQATTLDRAGQCQSNDGQYPSNDEQYPSNDGQYPRNDEQYPRNDEQYPRNDEQYPRNDEQYPSNAGLYQNNTGLYHNNAAATQVQLAVIPGRAVQYRQMSASHHPAGSAHPSGCPVLASGCPVLASGCPVLSQASFNIKAGQFGPHVSLACQRYVNDQSQKKHFQSSPRTDNRQHLPVNAKFSPSFFQQRQHSTESGGNFYDPDSDTPDNNAFAQTSQCQIQPPRQQARLDTLLHSQNNTNFVLCPNSREDCQDGLSVGSNDVDHLPGHSAISQGEFNPLGRSLDVPCQRLEPNGCYSDHIHQEAKKEIKAYLQKGRVTQVCGPPMAGKSTLVRQAIREAASQCHPWFDQHHINCKKATNFQDVLNLVARRICPQHNLGAEPDEDSVLEIINSVLQQRNPCCCVLVFHKCENLLNGKNKNQFSNFLATVAGRLTFQAAVLFTTYKLFVLPRSPSNKLVTVGTLSIHDIIMILTDYAPDVDVVSYARVLERSFCFPEAVRLVAEELLVDEKSRVTPDVLEKKINSDHRFLSDLFESHLKEVPIWIPKNILSFLIHFGHSMDNSFTEAHLEYVNSSEMDQVNLKKNLSYLKQNHVVRLLPTINRLVIHPLVVYYWMTSFSHEKQLLPQKWFDNTCNRHTHFVGRVLMSAEANMQEHGRLGLVFGGLFDEWPNVRYLIQAALHCNQNTYENFLKIAVSASGFILKFFPREAESFYWSMYTSARDLGSPREFAVMEALLGQAVAEGSGKDWDRADSYLSSAIQRLSVYGNSFYLGWAIVRRGIIQHRQGKYDESARIFHQSKSVLQNVNRHALGEDFYVTEARVEEEIITQEIHKTIPDIFRGLNILARQRLDHILGMIQNNFENHPELATLLNLVGLTEQRGNKNLEQALRWYKLSYSERMYFAKMCPEKLLAVLNNIGMILFHQGNTECIKYLNKALDIQRETGWTHYFTGLTLLHLAEIHMKTGNLAEAFNRALEAQRIFDATVKDHDVRLRVQFILAHLRIALRHALEGREGLMETSRYQRCLQHQGQSDERENVVGSQYQPGEGLTDCSQRVGAFLHPQPGPGQNLQLLETSSGQQHNTTATPQQQHNNSTRSATAHCGNYTEPWPSNNNLARPVQEDILSVTTTTIEPCDLQKSAEDYLQKLSTIAASMEGTLSDDGLSLVLCSIELLMLLSFGNQDKFEEHKSSFIKFSQNNPWIEQDGAPNGVDVDSRYRCLIRHKDIARYIINTSYADFSVTTFIEHMQNACLTCMYAKNTFTSGLWLAEVHHCMQRRERSHRLRQLDVFRVTPRMESFRSEGARNSAAPRDGNQSGTLGLPVSYRAQGGLPVSYRAQGGLPVSYRAQGGLPVSYRAQGGLPVSYRAQGGLPVSYRAQGGLPVSYRAQGGLPVSYRAQGGLPVSYRAQGGLPVSYRAQGGLPVSYTAQGGLPVSYTAQGGLPVSGRARGSSPIKPERTSVCSVDILPPDRDMLSEFPNFHEIMSDPSDGNQFSADQFPGHDGGRQTAHSCDQFPGHDESRQTAHSCPMGPAAQLPDSSLCLSPVSARIANDQREIWNKIHTQRTCSQPVHGGTSAPAGGAAWGTSSGINSNAQAGQAAPREFLDQSSREWLEQSPKEPVRPREWREQSPKEPVRPREWLEQSPKEPVRPREWLEQSPKEPVRPREWREQSPKVPVRQSPRVAVEQIYVGDQDPSWNNGDSFSSLSEIELHESAVRQGTAFYEMYQRGRMSSVEELGLGISERSISCVKMEAMNHVTDDFHFTEDCVREVSQQGDFRKSQFILDQCRSTWPSSSGGQTIQQSSPSECQTDTSAVDPRMAIKAQKFSAVDYLRNSFPGIIVQPGQSETCDGRLDKPCRNLISHVQEGGHQSSNVNQLVSAQEIPVCGSDQRMIVDGGPVLPAQSLDLSASTGRRPKEGVPLPENGSQFPSLCSGQKVFESRSGKLKSAQKASWPKGKEYAGEQKRLSEGTSQGGRLSEGTSQGGRLSEGTSQGGRLSEGSNVSIQGSRLSEGSNVSSQSGRLSEGSNVSSQGGRLSEGSNVSSQGGRLSEGSNVSSQGGRLSEGSNVSSQGGRLSEGSNVSSQGGRLSEGSNVSQRSRNESSSSCSGRHECLVGVLAPDSGYSSHPKRRPCFVTERPHPNNVTPHCAVKNHKRASARNDHANEGFSEIQNNVADNFRGGSPGKWDLGEVTPGKWDLGEVTPGKWDLGEVTPGKWDLGEVTPGKWDLGEVTPGKCDLGEVTPGKCDLGEVTPGKCDLGEVTPESSWAATERCNPPESPVGCDGQAGGWGSSLRGGACVVVGGRVVAEGHVVERGPAVLQEAVEQSWTETLTPNED